MRLHDDIAAISVRQSAGDRSRNEVLGRLMLMVATTESGRPDVYWYQSAVEVARSAGLMVEFAPVFRRARLWCAELWKMRGKA